MVKLTFTVKKFPNVFYFSGLFLRPYLPVLLKGLWIFQWYAFWFSFPHLDDLLLCVLVVHCFDLPWRSSSIFSKIWKLSWKLFWALQDFTYKCFEASLADFQLSKAIFCWGCLHWRSSSIFQNLENCFELYWIIPTNVTKQVELISCLFLVRAALEEM